MTDTKEMIRRVNLILDGITETSKQLHNLRETLFDHIPGFREAYSARVETESDQPAKQVLNKLSVDNDLVERFVLVLQAFGKNPV